LKNHLGTSVGLAESDISLSHEEVTQMVTRKPNRKRNREQGRNGADQADEPRRTAITPDTLYGACSERLTAFGVLAAAMAHEIKNPLNFVNNFSEVSLELIEEAREEVKKAGNIEGQDNSPLLRGAGGVSDEAESGEQPHNSDKDSNSDNTPLPSSNPESIREQAGLNPLSRGDLLLEILHDIEANITTIYKHGKRADSIVQGMLLHSRGKSGEKMATDINNLLDEYADLSFHGLRAKDPSFNAEIIKEFDQDLGNINVVPQDISRAFLNIINNGLQAASQHFKDQGVNEIVRIHISTKKVNGFAEIRIRDNGPGIPDSIREKIFEPFFTTKPGRLGLGLTLSRSLITNHGGRLWFTPHVAQGVTFHFTLPSSMDNSE
jgi:signal transduction histidine kinase